MRLSVQCSVNNYTGYQLYIMVAYICHHLSDNYVDLLLIHSLENKY